MHLSVLVRAGRDRTGVLSGMSELRASSGRDDDLPVNHMPMAFLPVLRLLARLWVPRADALVAWAAELDGEGP